MRKKIGILALVLLFVVTLASMANAANKPFWKVLDIAPLEVELTLPNGIYYHAVPDQIQNDQAREMTLQFVAKTEAVANVDFQIDYYTSPNRVTSLAPHPAGYWVDFDCLPADVRAQAYNYDAVFVHVAYNDQAPNVGVNWGGITSTGGYQDRTIYFSSIVMVPGYNWGTQLHEFCHIPEMFYASLGITMPDVHNHYGYTDSDQYFLDYLAGKVWINGQYCGVLPEMWQYTPLNAGGKYPTPTPDPDPDPTPTPDPDPSPIPTPNLGDSGGGCDAGFGVFTLLAVVGGALALKRR